MCGIIGIVGKHNVIPDLLDGLNKLSYRGYDSAGIAVVSDRIEIRKAAGTLEEVDQKVKLRELEGNVAIGHCRWATTGKVSDKNAHPFYDCTGEIAIVHNGIIENFQTLKSALIDDGHVFTSDTDSEVIAHLLEGIEIDDLPKFLKGSYAILSIENGYLDAHCFGSPLVIGQGDATYISSDISAIQGKVNSVYFMQDGDIASIRDEIVIHSNNHFYKYDELKMNVPSVIEFPTSKLEVHHMLNEIKSQPQAFERALNQDEKYLTGIVNDLLRSRQFIYTACGTSRYAALIGRYALSRLAGLFGDCVTASEFEYFVNSIDSNTLIIPVSQSGETGDIIQALKLTKEKHPKVISILNRTNSTISRMSDKCLYLNCGDEYGVAATKTFTSQLAVLYLMAYCAINQLKEGKELLKKFPDMIHNGIEREIKKIEQLAYFLKDRKDFYMIGRAVNFSVALEGALKLKEVSYVHAEGMSAGELKHGTLALIGEGVPVVAINPCDYTYSQTLSNVQETKARGAYVIGISDRPNEVYDEFIQIDKVNELLMPILSVIPLQLFAYYSALARGLPPDRPRNLAKAVTTI